MAEMACKLRSLSTGWSAFSAVVVCWLATRRLTKDDLDKVRPEKNEKIIEFYKKSETFQDPWRSAHKCVHACQNNYAAKSTKLFYLGCMMLEKKTLIQPKNFFFWIHFSENSKRMNKIFSSSFIAKKKLILNMNFEKTFFAKKLSKIGIFGRKN